MEIGQSENQAILVSKIADGVMASFKQLRSRIGLD